MKRNGFTLIELLIVVAHHRHSLQAIAVPNFLNAQTRAKIAQVESGIRALSTAFESYRIDWGGIRVARSEHRYNVWLNGLNDPHSLYRQVPTDIFQTRSIGGYQIHVECIESNGITS